MNEINQKREILGQQSMMEQWTEEKETERKRQAIIDVYQSVVKDLEEDLVGELAPLPNGANYLRDLIRQKGNFNDI